MFIIPRSGVKLYVFKSVMVFTFQFQNLVIYSDPLGVPHTQFTIRLINTTHFSNKHKMETVAKFQETLASKVIPRLTFNFNPRPAANVKKGMMFNLQKFNSHILTGLQVKDFTFFEKEYGSTIRSDQATKCSLKGFARIQNNAVEQVLIQKIRSGLEEATGKDCFDESCEIVLRICGTPSCTGTVDPKSIHYKCSQARGIFEKLRMVEICANTAAGVTPCLYNNFIHSHKEFNKLKIAYEEESGQYTVCNNDTGSFIINDPPSLFPEENIYSSYSSPLKGVLNVRLTGVYLKDENKSDTIKLWCTILKSNLLTSLPEMSLSCQAIEELGEDDILLGDKENDNYDNYDRFDN